jgi:hemerythrin
MPENNMEDKNIVEWDSRYALGIPFIDEQHKKLLDMTNKLYKACMGGDETARVHFIRTVHEAVDYVKYHFTAEERLMEKIRFPDLEAHKNEHRVFVRGLVRQAQDFKENKKFVPILFVRYLRDWILTHIAVSDKAYADYIEALRTKSKVAS